MAEKWNIQLMNKQLLIIFVRNPELGKVKTRLAKTVGNEVALAIYFQLLEKTKEATKDLDLDKVVYYSDEIDPNGIWDSTTYYKALQHGNDLGSKMKNAFKRAFQEGYKEVCLIGSDCLDITPETIQEAFIALKDKRAVIGAAEDGGYYLIGMDEYRPELFDNKAWSTDEVFISTLEDFERLDLSYHELPVLKDVDTEKDLKSWAATFKTNYLAD